MPAAVRFLLDGQSIEVPEAAPTLTVLEFLRDSLHRTGTKEGCAEGDCGACTVVLGELTPGGLSRYRAINSCIRLLPSIDGKELVTVESLQAADGALHPVQQAMVDQHGSQCGFCTPGFVMSLFALWLEDAQPTRERILDSLSGNLCRCTGYRPIIDAATHMGRYPRPAHWSRESAHDPRRADALRAIRRNGSLRLPGWYSPRTVDELAALLAAQPEALILAGGTDVGLWVTKQLRDLGTVVYLGEIEALQQVDTQGESIRIGAAVSLTDAWAAIAMEYPALAELAQRFGSPPVRNSGTLCGNLANGSPIGDSMPALIALGADIELRRGDGTRRLPLERLYLGYQRKDLQPGEFIVSVSIPKARTDRRIASYKISKRFDQDISAVCLAIALELDGSDVRQVRIAFGGMDAIPRRATAAERALTGKPWSLPALDAATAALASDFKPLSDLRASNSYRLEVAANLLRRFYISHRGSQMPLRVGDV
ncbi:MAG: xanthine dehydrogenase small subunit [Steroidobacteraceae bacterium]